MLLANDIPPHSAWCLMSTAENSAGLLLLHANKLRASATEHNYRRHRTLFYLLLLMFILVAM